MSAIEQEIIDIVKRMDDNQKQQILNIARELVTPEPEHKYPTLKDLMKLPYEERNRLVIESLKRSQNEDFEIFEAYSEEDFDDD